MTEFASSPRKVLLIALGLNFSMFLIESTAGVMNSSSGLLADSLDMLGDAAMYGVTLLALNRSTRWQAKASLWKGIAMATLAVGVLAESVHKLVYLHPVPTASAMGIVSILGLAANVSSAWLLMKYSSQNLNLKSVWLCSRNDALANVGVFIAGGLVALTQSALPDALIGAGIAILGLKSAWDVIKESLSELKSSG